MGKKNKHEELNRQIAYDFSDEFNQEIPEPPEDPNADMFSDYHDQEIPEPPDDLDEDMFSEGPEQEESEEALTPEQIELNRLAAKADRKDKISYNFRHFIYDISKSVIMGLKSFFSRKITRDQESRSFRISYNEMQPSSGKTENEIRIRIEAQKWASKELEKQYGPNGKSLLNNEEREEYEKQFKALTARRIQQQSAEKNIVIEMVAFQDINLGGTKPMTQYTDNMHEKWLVKQAVTCVGTHKLSGALLTEAGANLQKIVDPDTYVEAYSGRTSDHGDVSFQRRLKDVVSSSELDLFRFSRHPEIANKKTIKQVEQLGDQILREHITDWLLCNFDTKGENFIITRENSNSPMVLHGIDKEASFSHILDSDAQHMSYEYKPHANNTLYNVVFKMYAEGKIDLDLSSIENRVRSITDMDDEKYMELYKKYLDHVKEKEPEKYAAKYTAILERKQNLAKEYRNFFGNLVRARIDSLINAGENNKAAELKSKYLDDLDHMKMFSDVPMLTPAQENIRRIKQQGLLDIKIPQCRRRGMEKLLMAYRAEHILRTEQNPEVLRTYEKGFGQPNYFDRYQESFHKSKWADELETRLVTIKFDDVKSPDEAAKIVNAASIAPFRKAISESERMRDEADRMLADRVTYRISENYAALLARGKEAFDAAALLLKGEQQGVPKLSGFKKDSDYTLAIKLCRLIESERKASKTNTPGRWEDLLNKHGMVGVFEIMKNDPKISAGPEKFSVWDIREIIAPQRERDKLRYRAGIADKITVGIDALRHAFFNISKAVVMGISSFFSRKITESQEEKSFRISCNDMKPGPQKTETESRIQTQAREWTLNELEKQFHTKDREKLDPKQQSEYDKQYDILFAKKRNEEMLKKNVIVTMMNSKNINLGGTKPMVQYTDSNNQKWLVKQAVTAFGTTRIDGSLLTEAGANIQMLVDKDTAIEAFAGRTVEKGEVSFQRFIEHALSSKKLDLFQFSRHPEIADDETIEKIEQLGDQLLREHTTDWLLCNFDTKGENFIITQESEDSPMVLHGIDKEASFIRLLNPGAKHMNYTFKGHDQNTLYNAMFSMYAQGKLDLDLSSIDERVRRVAAVDDNTYMANFKKYLDHIQKNEPDKYVEKYTAILERKDNLIKEYRRFFRELVNERFSVLDKVDVAKARQLKDKYFDQNGDFKLFSDVPELSPAQESIRRMKRQGLLEIKMPQFRRSGMEKLLIAHQADNLIHTEQDQNKLGNLEKLFSQEDFFSKFQKQFHNSKDARKLENSLKKFSFEDVDSPDQAAEFVNETFSMALGAEPPKEKPLGAYAEINPEDSKLKQEYTLFKV